MTNDQTPLLSGARHPAVVTDDERHSTDEILRSLASVTEYPHELGRFASTSVDDLMAWLCWDDGMQPFYGAMEDHFGFQTEEQEWLLFSRPETTVYILADFIASKAPVRPIGAVKVLGRSCLKAGVFRMLVRHAEHVVGRVPHVGPSANLLESLSKEQLGRVLLRAGYYFPGFYASDRVWNSLDLSKPAAAATAVAFLSAAVLTRSAPSLAEWLLGSCAIGLLLLMPALLAVALFSLPVLLLRHPLRPGVRTYRDLVEILVSERDRRDVLAETEPCTQGCESPAAAPPNGYQSLP